jgi:NAD(P)-dependent dehydrogenase (short-subunit alcohol dehydrogenase family)
MVQPSLNTEVYPAIHPDNFTSQFTGKLVVVTGAARGIGRSISLAFAKAGADLALLDFDVPRQSETKSLCEAQGVKVSTFGCDVTKYDVCKQVVREIEKLGDVDVLVNNAGGGPIKGFTSSTFDEYWGGVEQNFKGVQTSGEVDVDFSYDASYSSRDEKATKGMCYQYCITVILGGVMLMVELEQRLDHWEFIIILGKLL